MATLRRIKMRLLLAVVGFAVVFIGCYLAEYLPRPASSICLAGVMAGWIAMTAGLIGIVAPPIAHQK